MTQTPTNSSAPGAAEGRVPAAATAHPQDATLEAVFDEVRRTRMADLPFLNPNLRVEAVGFRDWQGARVGALITPWSIVIVAMPGTEPAAVRRLPTGQSQEWAFPSGAYEFYGHDDPALGHYQQCSLFSPALEFATHDAARAAAQAALDALFTAPTPPGPKKFSRRGLLTGA